MSLSYLQINVKREIKIAIFGFNSFHSTIPRIFWPHPSTLILSEIAFNATSTKKTSRQANSENVVTVKGLIYGQ